MKQRVSNVYALIMIPMFILMSCAADQDKQPTVEVQIAEKAFDLSNVIKDAFLNGDRQALKALCSDDLYEELSSLMNTFPGKDLEFTLRWVDIDFEGTIHLYVTWKRSPMQQQGSEQASGLAVFVMTQDPLVAREIIRENPFAQ